MKKANTRKIEVAENGHGESEKDMFASEYDPIKRRISYDSDFRDYCVEELFFIAGVLDMLFLINDVDQWDNRGKEIAFVIMDARNRANALTNVV
jgi:hypothetical protein